MTPEELTEICEKLGHGPVAMARAMGSVYPTLRDWKSGKTPIKGVPARCAELLLEVQALTAEIERLKNSK